MPYLHQTNKVATDELIPHNTHGKPNPVFSGEIWDTSLAVGTVVRSSHKFSKP